MLCKRKNLSNICSCQEKYKIGKKSYFEALLQALRGTDIDTLNEEDEIKVQGLCSFSIAILFLLSTCNLRLIQELCFPYSSVAIYYLFSTKFLDFLCPWTILLWKWYTCNLNTILTKPFWFNDLQLVILCHLK